VKSAIRDGLAILSAWWLILTLFVFHSGGYARVLQDPSQALPTVAAAAYLIAFGFWKVVRRWRGW
jgi:hypothetical protein